MNAVLMARRRSGALPRAPRTGLAEPDVYTITPTQRNVHVTFEALAVFVAVPFTAYLAFSPRLKPWERTGLAAMTLATLVVDGGLLYSYLKKKKGACP
jgi:hypothetical protein